MFKSSYKQSFQQSTDFMPNLSNLSLNDSTAINSPLPLANPLNFPFYTEIQPGVFHPVNLESMTLMPDAPIKSGVVSPSAQLAHQNLANQMSMYGYPMQYPYSALPPNYAPSAVMDEQFVKPEFEVKTKGFTPTASQKDCNMYIRCLGSKMTDDELYDLCSP